MTIDFGIKECLDVIFGGVIATSIKKDTPPEIVKKKLADVRVNLERFKRQFTVNVFSDEYALFYEILCKKNIKAFSIAQFRTVVDNNRDLILKSAYIDTSKYAMTASGNSTTEDEIFAAFKANAEELLEELSMKMVTEDEFLSAINIYKDYYKTNFMIETSQTMVRIISDEVSIRLPGGKNKLYRGADGAQEYYRYREGILKSIADEQQVVSETLDAKWLDSEVQRETEDNSEEVIDTGLSEIDSTIGKFRRGNLISILGPTKGGKTRFTVYLVYRALKQGFNVCIWPLEGSEQEWISMLTALYIADNMKEMYGSKYILDKKYLKDGEKGKKIQSYVIEAKTKFSLGGSDFGKLTFIKGTAYEEDFIDVIEGVYTNENPFDVIVVDSLINVMSRKNVQKSVMLSSAYMKFKDLINNKLKIAALGLVPAQLKQSAVDALRANPDSDIDITSGGETAETIRSADEAIGLFSSKEEREAGCMKLYSVASRHSSTFNNFIARTSLGCCHFCSDPSLNN